MYIYGVILSLLLKSGHLNIRKSSKNVRIVRHTIFFYVTQCLYTNIDLIKTTHLFTIREFKTP